MSAGLSLQSALVIRAQSFAELSGVYDGPPPRAAYPYLVVDCGSELDWGTKDRVGREVTALITLWDDQPARLQRLADAVETAIGAQIAPSDWTVAGWRFVRRNIVRDVAGPWATSLEFRARMLAQD